MPIYYIYRIYSITNDKVYVGSTIDFNKRRIEHKSNCYNKNSKKYYYKLYRTIRKYDGWNYFIMGILASFDYNTKKERLQREKDFMILYRANLNSRSALRTNEERIQNQRTYRNNIKNESPEKREIRLRKKEQRRKMKEDIENDIDEKIIV